MPRFKRAQDQYWIGRLGNLWYFGALMFLALLWPVTLPLSAYLGRPWELREKTANLRLLHFAETGTFLP